MADGSYSENDDEAYTGERKEQQKIIKKSL